MSPQPDASPSAAAFILGSASTDLQLRFFDLRSDYVTAELSSTDFRITRDVSTYMEGERLPLFFQDLAAQEKPWTGKKTWSSLEGEFSIEAACKVTGQVTFTIFTQRIGHAEDWTFTTELTSELGQMPALAAAATSFFRFERYVA